MTLKYHLLLIFCIAALVGCQTTAGKKSPASGQGTESVIVRDFTPFYVLGPAQPSGPDLSLRNGEHVMLLKKEWGYSHIQLEDQRTGYVSNDAIAPAPPSQKPFASNDPQSKKRKGSAAYNGAQVNDAPLPDLPPPNLNIAPEDVPEPSSSPQGPPPKPGFRY